MSSNGADLCLRCMSRMEGRLTCPICGWHDDAVYDLQYAKPGTMLSGRYLLGLIVRKNGEGALYIGYDNATAQMVWIREYFPVTIAQRAIDTGRITPLAGCGAQYKALMSDFVDICNEIKRLGVTEPVVPLENVVSENNTVYAVFKGLDLISFEDYLEGVGGTLPHKQALAMLMPICNTLGAIHNHGHIHRGISPWSIYVDEDNKLWLWDFALGATRTAGSELDSELFSGYSAPEQYSPNGWQGSWTDVYAAAALLYRTLTGIVPPKSIRIDTEHPLAPLSEVLPELPRQISDAVANAMQSDTQDRFQAIQTFLSNLTQTQAHNTAVYDTNKVAKAREEANKKNPKALRKKQKSGGTFKYVVLGLLIMLVILFGIIWYFVNNFLGDILPEASQAGPAAVEESSQASPGTTNTSGAAQTDTVPEFFGLRYEDISQDPQYLGQFTFSPRYDYNDYYEEGLIYDQAPSVGTKISGHATIIVYVSKGPPKVVMPDLVGKKVEDVADILRNVEITNFEIIERYVADAEGGVVLRTSPSAEEELDPRRDRVVVEVTMDVPVVEGQSEEDRPPQPADDPDDPEASESSPPTIFFRDP